MKSVQEIRVEEYRRLLAQGAPYWLEYTSGIITGDAQYSLAPKSGFVRQLLYIKAYHTDAAGNRYVSYSWNANALNVIHGSTVAANTSVLLTNDEIPFPVVMYPTSFLIARAIGLTADTLVVAALVHDIEDERY